MAGLTSTGFEIDTIDEIVDSISQDLKDRIDSRLDTTPTSVLGQAIGVFAERTRLLQELARDTWSAFTPEGASGFSLTQLALITGTKRQDKDKSTVTATVNLDASTTLPAGSTASVDGSPLSVFETVADAANPGVIAADISVVMRATKAGAVRANAGTLIVIASPFSGWNSVTNAEDAELGREDETDPELRVRREEEIRQQGSSTIDAIVADVLQVSGVIDVRGFENLAADTPPNSFLVMVWDGDPAAADDDAIAQTIWDSKPAGIGPYGDVSATAIDYRGDEKTMYFSRATQKDVYLEIDLTIDADEYPVDGDDQIKAAIVAFAGDRWKIGSDVILSALYSSIFSIPGVVSVDAIRAGFTVSPSGTANLTIADIEIALADTGRIELSY